MRTIYVIGWVGPGTGGFDWLYTKDGAFEIMQSMIRNNPGLPIRYTTREVPEGMKAREITALLDADPDSWQPPAR